MKKGPGYGAFSDINQNYFLLNLLEFSFNLEGFEMITCTSFKPGKLVVVVDVFEEDCSFLFCDFAIIIF